MSNPSVEILLKERAKLIIERDRAIANFHSQISGLEASIEELSGKKVWEMTGETIYDDEHSDYIRQSVEEM